MDKETIANLKSEGFLFQNDKEHFAVRVVIPIGKCRSEDLAKLSEIADKYGRGELALTVRTGIEIPYIKFEDIDNVKKELDDANLLYGGTGAKVRPLVACKGSYCARGLLDSQELGLKLHGLFYHIETPAKFKINIAACPNNCTKVQLNDIGIKKAKGGVAIYVGGKQGRRLVVGKELDHVVPEDQIIPTITKILEWYKAKGKDKERIGELVLRMKEEDPYFKIDDILDYNK